MGLLSFWNCNSEDEDDEIQFVMKVFELMHKLLHMCFGKADGICFCPSGSLENVGESVRRR